MNIRYWLAMLSAHIGISYNDLAPYQVRIIALIGLCCSLLFIRSALIPKEQSQ